MACAPHPPARWAGIPPGGWVRCASLARPTHPPRGQHPTVGCCPPPGGQRPISLEYQIYLPAIDTIVTGLGPTTTTQLQRLSVAFALQLRPGPTCRDVICTQDVRKVKLTLSFIALFAVFGSDKSFINLEPTFICKKIILWCTPTRFARSHVHG